MKRKLMAMALACGLAASWSAMAVEDFLDLSSPDFEDGGKLPMKYGGNNPQNPNCTGENISPALDWKNAPAGTKSFAIILFDTAGRAPSGVVHWFAYGLPPTKMGFKEGEATQPPSGYIGGKSTMNLPTYSGPARPKGREGASLCFHSDGVQIAPDAIKAGLPPDEFVKEVQAAGAKLLQSVSLVSRYGH